MLRSNKSVLPLDALSDQLADLVEQVLPSVATLRGLDTALNEWSGSGFIVDDQGHLITNHHVVDGMGETMTVSLHGGTTVKANVIGSDPVTDLAVLSLDTSLLPALGIRTSPPRLGELCIAIGSPLGQFAESISLGVVSGLDRSIPTQQGSWPMEHMIQTDAAVNHGNSGGPLLDVRGFVIGVNDCGREDGQNISFAIPAETVSAVAAELIEHGSVMRSGLGVVISNRSMPIDGPEGHRLTVSEVKVATPLKAGDLLLDIAGRDVRDRGDLFRALNRDLVGKPTSITVVRDGTPVTVEVVPFEARRN